MGQKSSSLTGKTSEELQQKASETPRNFEMGQKPSSLTEKKSEDLQQKACETPKQMSNAEWQDLLGKQRYYVTREKDTEKPFSSCLNKEKREGIPKQYHSCTLKKTFFFLIS